MTETPFHRILATTAICLAAGVCVVHADTCRAADAPLPCTAPLKKAVAQQSLSEQAEAVWFAYTRLPKSWLLEKLVDAGDGEIGGDELIDFVRKDIEAIRPCSEMLRTLPSERVKELFMLVDAVLWQSQWLDGVYRGEFGVEVEAPFDMGLKDLSRSAAIVKSVLKGEKAVSPEVESVLRMLVELVGGEQVLDYPAAWYDEQWAVDYKTALQFYKEFCAAACAEDEAQAVAKLKELEQVVAYFAAKGEGEIWRVNKLAGFFYASLVDLRAGGLSPYPEPVLSEKYRTPSRMKALQPFIDTFPALKDLLYL